MADAGPVDVAPIVLADVGQVAEFLHLNLNSRVSAAVWRDAMTRRWVDAPNFGFMLRVGDEVVGAYLAFYSGRLIEGRVEKICNLGAWCVLDPFRSHGLRLLRAMLRQRDYTFTDLSPSGNVIGLNQRLGFTSLDTTAAVVPNLPWVSRRHRIVVTSDPVVVEGSLSGAELALYRDHADLAAARNVLIRAGDETCYVILRKDRRKLLPVFASILYVSNLDLFRRAARPFSNHVLTHHRLPVTLAELRIVGSRPPGSVLLPSPRPKMFKSSSVDADHIDYLYSELTNVAW